MGVTLGLTATLKSPLIEDAAAAKLITLHRKVGCPQRVDRGELWQ